MTASAAAEQTPPPVEVLAEYAPRVWGKIGLPLDRWAVTATLESLGLRDVDAKENMGAPDLFVFSEFLYAYIIDQFEAAQAAGEPLPGSEPEPSEDAGDEEPQAGASAEGTAEEGAADPPRKEHAPLKSAKEVLFDVLQGSFFAMPMIGQMICVITTRYSLWASLDFTEQQATEVGLGTVASFAVTGGLVLSIGRQGTAHLGARAYTLLRKTLSQLIRVATVLSALVGIGSLITNTFIVPLVPAAPFMTALIYYAVLCAMWLSLAALYMLGLHAYSFGVTFAGGLVVAALVRWVGLPVGVAQPLCILLCTIAAVIVADRGIAKRSEDEDSRYEHAPLPPNDVSMGILAPFGLYGFSYFLFLFVDRLMAWTAPGRALPEPIWFHTPYELGMDWALISLLLPMAYLERVVRVFAPNIVKGQEKLTCHELDSHRRSLLWFGVKALLVVLALSIFSVVGSYFLVQSLRTFNHVPEIRQFFSSETTEEVYWIAAPAYQLLTLGLMSGLLCFTLARPYRVVTQMTYALVASLAVGFLCSRIMAPYYAVIGFAAGSGIFAVAMLNCGRDLLGRIDFYYYSAF